MVGRLAALGFDVQTYDREPSDPVSEAPAGPGVRATWTPFECARDRDVVVTFFDDATSLEAALEGPDGALRAFRERKEAKRARGTQHRKHRTVLVDVSTIGRAAAVRVGARVDEAGGKMVDAPLAGSTRAAAIAGDVITLVGGSVRAVERARPVLEAIARKVIHAGGVGQGQALKVVLAGVAAHHLIALTSMLALGERAGLARDVLLEGLTSGPFATPSYVGKRDKLLARDYSPEVSLATALREIRLNRDLQDDLAVTLPVLRAILADVERGVAEGLGELDSFALEKQY